ncbi:MAG: transposase [Syntrophomonadaceae bacterium]|nr:transposase [Syntrophomonadaceae bacterium]
MDGSSADWGVKQNTDGNKIAWFGYKLPIALEATPASVHDSSVAPDIIKQVKENVKTPPRYYLMDSGYDSTDIYKSVK